MARPNLKSHRKFRRLVLMLGMPEAHVRGHLEYLWDSAYESGDEIMGDATDVELAAGWAGEPGKLTDALAKCGGENRVGFIELIDGEYRIHDLWDHAPEYVTKRATREAERREKGETLSSIRAAAGRKGALVTNSRSANGIHLPENVGNCPANENHLPEISGNCPANENHLPEISGKRPANENHLPEISGKRPANGVTPTPAPTPAPNKNKARQAEPEIPESLNTAPFVAAWNSWRTYRTEIKKKLTPTMIRQQFAKLESWGVDAAVEAINTSIANGWQGLFEPKGGALKKQQPEDDYDGPFLNRFEEESDRAGRWIVEQLEKDDELARQREEEAKRNANNAA